MLLLLVASMDLLLSHMMSLGLLLKVLLLLYNSFSCSLFRCHTISFRHGLSNLGLFFLLLTGLSLFVPLAITPDFLFALGSQSLLFQTRLICLFGGYLGFFRAGCHHVR